MVSNYIWKSNQQKDAMQCSIVAVVEGSITHDTVSSHEVSRLLLQNRDKKIKEGELNIQQCGLKDISIQNELIYTEVNAIAHKIKNTLIKRDSSAVTLAVTTNNTLTNNQEQFHKDCEGVHNKQGRFSWKLIDGYYLPYIIRVINGVKLKFVSVRMAETQLLSRFLHSLHSDLYTCTSVTGYHMTDSEAGLLNEINNLHSDFAFGSAIFFARKDYIVLLEDAYEFYTFLDACYKSLLFNNNTIRKEKCGFIRIDSEFVVAYTIKDSQKYIPLFYFEGETENLQHLTVKLENWDLAYLKFCCKVQGFSNNEYFAGDLCTAISLDDIKNFYSTETNFEEYWPPKIVDTQLLTNSTHVNPSGVWIKAPFEVIITENSNVPHTLTESAPVLPDSMPVMINSYQNGWPANQLSTALSQGSSLINGAGHVVSLPPLVRAGNTAPIIGNSVSCSNIVPVSQCITTMYDSMTNINMISHSNQIQQLYSHCASNNSQAPQHWIQQQQQQQQMQQQQHQQQQMITVPQTQQLYSSQSVHHCLTNPQLHNVSRNEVPTTESIDLSSQPCNSMPPTVQKTSLRPRVGWELTRIPERVWTGDTNIAAYKIKQEELKGKLIRCINAEPYQYSNLLITLPNLVQVVLSSWTVTKCAHFLQKYLKITLFGGNTEQLALLRENGLISSTNSENTPMVMLQDIRHWLNTGASLSKFPHPYHLPNSMIPNNQPEPKHNVPAPPYM